MPKKVYANACKGLNTDNFRRQSKAYLYFFALLRGTFSRSPLSPCTVFPGLTKLSELSKEHFWHQISNTEKNKGAALNTNANNKSSDYDLSQIG